jgi:WD40 repeat protein
MNTSNADLIKVIVRFRPPRETIRSNRFSNNVNVINNSNSNSNGNSSNISSNAIELFKLNQERNEVEYISEYLETKTFKYDKILGMNCNQVEVFDEVNSTVNSLIDGFNGTIMAYGQTSAGNIFLYLYTVLSVCFVST